jgi:hypothetical protein
MVRMLRPIVLIAACAGALSLAGRAGAVDKPCAIATKGDSPVAKACTQGGIIDAKKAMRDMLRDGKRAGVKFECDDCHKNDVGYDLTPDARDKFKKLLGALEPKK